MSDGEFGPTRVPWSSIFIMAMFFVTLLLVGIFGGWTTVSDAQRNEDRDFRMRSIENSQFHDNERFQKQIDELRARIEKLETR